MVKDFLVMASGGFFLCRSLNHPNILSLMGIVPSSSSTTIITNLVNGSDLHSILFNSEENVKVHVQCMAFIPK